MDSAGASAGLATAPAVTIVRAKSLVSSSATERSKYVFLSGAIAGTVEGIAVQPLEFLKTR